MRKTQILLMCCALIGTELAAQAQKIRTPKSQKQSKTVMVELEIRGFLDALAEDLRQHRREAIANRHDRRGYYRMGNGKKTFFSFEQIKNHYLNKWRGPKSFQWRDITIEVLSPTSAVVLALFDWQTAAGKTVTLSYTGIFIKSSGEWRIRVEDESAQLNNPASQ